MNMRWQNVFLVLRMSIIEQRYSNTKNLLHFWLVTLSKLKTVSSRLPHFVAHFIVKIYFDAVDGHFIQ